MQSDSSETDLRVIYDIGANTGDDLAYYLLKADRVVAVEANADLCRRMAEEHEEAVASGRLAIVNSAVMARRDRSARTIPFYLHDNHVLSTLVEPKAHLMRHYRKVEVDALTLDELFARHGAPWFAKIDIEGYDSILVEDLFAIGIFPQYLSCEIHSRRAARQVLGCREYRAFKLVEGADVARDYAAAKISTAEGPCTFSFPAHAAGPFGEDVLGPWYDRPSMQRLIRARGYGWRDLHASRCDEGEQVAVEMPPFNPLAFARSKLVSLLPGRVRGRLGL